MAESRIKIKASVNEINEHFKTNPSELFYIKWFNGEKYYTGDDNKVIVFETLIRHNEIGNRNIERNSPYTLDTLEKTLSSKVKEYDAECQEIENLCDKCDDREFEIITRIHNLENKNCYTVARIIKDDKCTELHYNQGKAHIEFGTKISDDAWENEIKEDIDWFNLKLTDVKVLEHLNNEYNSHFEERQIENEYDYDY